MSESLLVLEGVHAGYGRVGVLRGIDIRIGEGELVTLIGANGAGKSTLLRAIVGAVRVSAGSIRFAGRDITASGPECLVGQGIALVPEGRLLFGSMSVRENLDLGAYTAPGGARGPQAKKYMRRVWELFPVLAERSGQAAETLSGGEQQMLAVGRALMSDPRLLLLDEPSLGLAPKVTAEIFGVLDALRREGATVLLVEQDAKLALKHADRGYVMRTGAIALAGTSAELLADESVRTIYLGTWNGEGARR